jgi:hypothetical protein
MTTRFTYQVTMIHRLSPLHKNIRAVATKLFLNLIANCNKRLDEICFFFDCENKSVLIMLIALYTELRWCVLISQVCKAAILALMSVSCQRDEVSNDMAFTKSLGNPSLSRWHYMTNFGLISEDKYNSYRKVLYFSIENAHLMYNAQPKLFRHSFWCIDKAHDAN